MEYISTKELAESWNISISRVVRLAKAGRIQGAHLVGKSWVFPSDCQKPADKRRKSSGIRSGSVFHFPLYFHTSYSEEEIRNHFSESERALYDAELLFLKGRVSESVSMLEQLNTPNQNRYVRFGALYYLCIGSISLHSYSKARHYYHEIKLLFSEETDHSHELEFPIHDLETYFVGNNYYLEEFYIDPEHIFPSEMQGYLLLESAYSDIIRCLINKSEINPVPYQIVCRNGTANLGKLTEIMLPLYTAFLLKSQDRSAESRACLLQACSLAKKNAMENTVAEILQYCPEFLTEVLKDNDPQLLELLNAVLASTNEAFQGLLNYLEKSELFQLLNPFDYQLILYAGRGATHKEIASAMHLSAASISKKYAALYEKTGTHNKKELVRIYKEVIRNY